MTVNIRTKPVSFLKRLCLSVLTSALVISGSLSYALSASAAPLFEADSDIGQTLNLPVCKWHDPDKPTQGVIVGLHGMTFYAEAFDDLSRKLADEGYVFYALDIRGFGRWKTEAERFNSDDKVHFDRAKEDLIRVLAAARSANPDTKVFCVGESLGANLLLTLLSSEPNLTDGAILSAPGFKRILHPRPRWIVDFFKGLAGPTKPFSLEPYITPYLSNDKEVTQAVIMDPKIHKKASPVELIKTSITLRRSLKNLDKIPEDMPILVLAGEEDRVFKTKYVEPYARKFGSKQTDVRVLPGKGHLLLEHQVVDQEIAAIITEWLADKTKQQLVYSKDAAQTTESLGVNN